MATIFEDSSAGLRGDVGGIQDPLAGVLIHYGLANTQKAPLSRPSPTGGLRPALTTASSAEDPSSSPMSLADSCRDAIK